MCWCAATCYESCLQVCFDNAGCPAVRRDQTGCQDAHEKAVIGLSRREQRVLGIRFDRYGNQAARFAIHRTLVEISGEGRAGAHAFTINQACLAER